MEDHIYTGTQFTFDDEYFFSLLGGLPPEDFNNEFDLIVPSTNETSSLVWTDTEYNPQEGLVNDSGPALIGSHSGPSGDFDFDAALGTWDEYIDFDEALSSYLGSQYIDEEPHTASQTIPTDTTLSPSCRDDDPSFQSKDQEPGASATNRTMPNEPSSSSSSSRESLQCPQRIAERESGLEPKCTGLKAKSMTDVRRHLSRPPHSMFVKLCKVCNVNILDEDIFNNEHGDRGQFCDILGSQSRGKRQMQEWRLLRDQLKKRMNPQKDIGKDSAIRPTDSMDIVNPSSSRQSSSPTRDPDVERCLDADPPLYLLPAEHSLTDRCSDSVNPRTGTSSLLPSTSKLITAPAQHTGLVDHFETPHGIESHVIIPDFEITIDPLSHTAKGAHSPLLRGSSYDVSSQTVAVPLSLDRYSWTDVWTPRASHPYVPGLSNTSVPDDSTVAYSTHSAYAEELTEIQPFQKTYTERIRHFSEYSNLIKDRYGVPFEYRLDRAESPLEVGPTPHSVTSPQFLACPSMTESSESTLSQNSGVSRMSDSSSSLPPVLHCSEPGCSMTFHGDYRRGNLGRHIRQKHRGWSGDYPCKEPHCGRTFKRSDARLKHYRKCHPRLAAGPPVRRGP